MRNIFPKATTTLQHLGAMVILFLIFLPIARFYLSNKSPVGNDYFHGLTFANFFKENLTLPVLGWEYFWHSGTAVFNGYQWLHFYLMQPLVRIFDSAAWGMEVYSIFAIFLYVLFSYFLFQEVSQSKFLALILSIIILYSTSTFVQLFRYGFITGSATQFFLPLVLYLIARFLRTGNYKLLFGSAMLTSLSIFGHFPIGFSIVLPISLLVLSLGINKENKIFTKLKLKDAFIWLFLVIFGAAIMFYPFLDQMFRAPFSKLAKPFDLEIVLKSLYDWTNPVLFIFLGSLVAILFFKRIIFNGRINLKRNVPYFAAFIFFLSYWSVLALNLIGVVSVMYPQRLIWVGTLFFGLFTACLFNELSSQVQKRFRPAIYGGLFMVILFLVSFLGQNILTPKFNSFRLGPEVFPWGIEKYITDKYQDKNKDFADLIPSWLNVDEKNYRFHDPSYNLISWWNTAAKVPTTEGFSNFPRGQARDWHFWLNTALTDNFKKERSREILANEVGFLIDWYGIRYLEDGREASRTRDKPYASYLLDNENFIDGKERKNGLTFFRVKKEATSPIAAPTNAATLYIVGSDEGYNNTVRALAVGNLNSQIIIPIKGPGSISDISERDFQNFDAVLLYDYKSTFFEKAWEKLQNFVEEGGALIVETGGEVGKSAARFKNLPSIFPIKKLNYEDSKKELNLSIEDSSIAEDIDFMKFSPLVFQGEAWGISFSRREDLKEGARIVLSQDSNPVLVVKTVKNGNIIWSGLNLPYHLTYYDNIEEFKLFKNMLSWGLDLSSNEPIDFSFKREKPEEIIIGSSNFRGILFKENFDNGWRAYTKFGDEKKEIKIYLAGLGFMYARIPSDTSFPVQIELRYKGFFLPWFLFSLSVLTIFAILDYVVFNGKIAVRRVGKLFGKQIVIIVKPLSKWWRKEDE